MPTGHTMSDSDQHQFKDRYMLRLPDGMRDRIKAAAEANSRSMNAEIIAALEDKFPQPTTLELETKTLAEIMDYVAGATTGAEFKRRFDEVNRELKTHEFLCEFEIRYRYLSPEGLPEEVYMTRAKTGSLSAEDKRFLGT